MGTSTARCLVVPLDSTIIEPFVRAQLLLLSQEHGENKVDPIVNQKHIETFNDESEEDEPENISDEAMINQDDVEHAEEEVDQLRHFQVQSDVSIDSLEAEPNARKRQKVA